MNPRNALLAPDGHTSLHLFGGQSAYKTGFLKGYFYSLEWLITGRECEPMLILQGQTRGISDGALGIALSSIGAYADPDTTSSAAPGALERCRAQLDVLGRARLDVEAKLLLDVILQLTPQLILMPVAPNQVRRDETSRRGAVMDVTRSENGRTMSEVAL